MTDIDRAARIFAYITTTVAILGSLVVLALMTGAAVWLWQTIT